MLAGQKDKVCLAHPSGSPAFENRLLKRIKTGDPDGTNEKTGLLSVNLKGGESKSLESDTACLLFCIQKPFKAWGLWGFWIQKSTGKAGAFK
jgi:hypothetical protein